MQSAGATHYKNSHSYGGYSTTAVPMPDGTTILPNITDNSMGASTALHLEMMDRTRLLLSEISHKKLLGKCFQAWRMLAASY